MSWSDYLNVAVNFVALVVAFAAVSGAVLAIFALISLIRSARAPILLAMPAALPLGFAAICAGYLTGLSREPAVAALVPGALTLLGGVGLLLVGGSKAKAGFIAVSIALFSANLVVGTAIGARSRDNRDAELTSVRAAERAAERELAIRMYRSALGLPVAGEGARP